MQEIHDVVIIGGGPAGLSAALYVSRAGYKPLVLAGSPPGGQLTLTTEVENFPGSPGVQGPELVERMRKQTEEFGTKVINENVTNVNFDKKPFELSYGDKTILSRGIIIATGAQAVWLGLESEQRLRGKGVSACATCDGFFFRNKTVAIVGGGDTAMEEAGTLTKFAQKVYIIHRKDFFRASKIMQQRVFDNPKIEIIWNAQIKEILGENKVEGIDLLIQNSEQTTSQHMSVDGVFVAIGHKPDTELFRDKIELNRAGYILTLNQKAEAYLRGEIDLSTEQIIAIQQAKTHYSTATSIEGVFAAGDCVDHVYRQASTAAGMGVAAALDIERYLQGIE